MSDNVPILDLADLLGASSPSALHSRGTNCLPASRLRNLAIHLSDFPMDDLRHALDCEYCRRSLHLIRRYEMDITIEPTPLELPTDAELMPTHDTIGARGAGFSNRAGLAVALFACLLLVTIVVVGLFRWMPQDTIASYQPKESSQLVVMGQQRHGHVASNPATVHDAHVLATPVDHEEQRRYVVRAGDSLSEIAQRELGSASRLPEILRLNDVIVDPDFIRDGQVLVLPARSEEVTG